MNLIKGLQPWLVSRNKSADVHLKKAYSATPWSFNVGTNVWLESLTAQALASFFITLVVIISLSPVAVRVGLTDAPSERKQHQGDIPIVGGISIFVALTAAVGMWGELNQNVITVNDQDALWVFIGCGAFLVATGVCDDRFHLGIFVRMLSEVLVAICVIELLDLKVAHLGDLFNSGVLRLNATLAYPFTVIAIFGVMNAFNMLDGIDGLLAALVIITLILFHLFTATEPGSLSLSVAAALCAFLVSNLNLTPIVPKTFLGDAGSKLLGFIVACLLIAAASEQVGNTKLISPVTALFLVALPLFDMVFTTARRVIRKGSPFASDRSHIHHLMQDLGFSDRRALWIIGFIHLNLVLLGLVLHLAKTPDYYQFAIFVGCFSLYSAIASQLWQVAKRLKNAGSDRLSGF